MNNGWYSILIWLVVLVVALISVGCASHKWVRGSNGSEEAFRADVKACEYQINLFYRPYQPNHGGIGAALAAGLGDAFRKNELMKECMEIKGWERKRKTP